MRAHDWSGHPLGPPERWPGLLRHMVNYLLSSPESIYLLWGDALHFFSNDAYRPVLGPRVDRAIGTTLAALWPDAIDAVRPLIDQALAGEATRHHDLPIRMARRGEPEDTWWTFSFSPLAEDDGRICGVLCHTTETTQHVVSEQRRDLAESRLREINDRLEAEVTSRTRERNRIWEVSRDMLLVADRAGVWLSVNPAWTAALGWSEAELLGRTSEWLEHPDDRDRTRAEVGKLAGGERTRTFENRLRTRDGDYRRLSWTAVPEDSVLYCVARDITDEHLRDTELRERTRIQRESEARARAYFLTTPEYVMLLRADASGELAIEDINPSVEHLIGRPRAEVFGASPRSVLPPDAVQDLERGVRECLRTGHNHTYTARRVYPGRSDISVETVMAVVERHAGFGGLVLLIARDRTDQRRAEEQLRQSQKMEAVGQLTGGVAHDFNNLLSTIGTCLELVRRKVKSGDVSDVPRFVDTADRSVQSAAALTHRLLAFSRKQSLDLRPVDANQLARSLEDIFSRTLGEQIAVELRLDEAAWPVQTDANQLENALLNLAINARDAMPHGGQLTIETRNLQVADDLLGQSELAEGDYVVISVSDNGLGMPKEVIDRAFDPFFTTKNIGKGTGLGLSMIYGYVKQSGGHVSIFSIVGEGTTVKLFLPRALTPHSPQEIASPPEVVAGAGERILVVDDNTDLRRLLEESLTEQGYVVTAVGDAHEAMERLDDESFDLLITDVGLPDLSGRRLADLVRDARPTLPVLLITGYAKEAAVRGDFVGEGMDMLAKPFALGTLTQRLQELLRRR
ncbi:PAS domain-containing protein [Roseateles amylovorans]|uniref:histidine kinase n=1 Tax=Roseateles amylovorans TaxID=2978473 RepID=A0ABY6B552_9BURK|nr:PAS domain-containing protein [Roseateles amylovorans]UXH80503.1 PAS domain-containing protein [Roseateles amylovorans]